MNLRQANKSCVLATEGPNKKEVVGQRTTSDMPKYDIKVSRSEEKQSTSEAVSKSEKQSAEKQFKEVEKSVRRMISSQKKAVKAEEVS